MREEFKLILSNRFQALQELVNEEEAATTEQQWKAVTEALNSTCKDTVGFRKHHHKDWLLAQTLKKIEVRKQKKAAVNNSRTRAATARAQEEYSEANREVKRSIRVDKRAYIDSLTAEEEKAAGSSNMKQLYDITRRLTGKYGHLERPVKDKEGKPITDRAGQLNRWAEHFEELLNTTDIPDIQPAETDLLISCDRPTGKRSEEQWHF